MQMESLAMPVDGEVNILRVLRRVLRDRALQRANRIGACSTTPLTVHIHQERIRS
jgi:hypothetical protein